MKTSQIRTREQWWTVMADIFRDRFREIGAPLPEKRLPLRHPMIA